MVVLVVDLMDVLKIPLLLSANVNQLKLTFFKEMPLVLIKLAIGKVSQTPSGISAPKKREKLPNVE